MCHVLEHSNNEVCIQCKDDKLWVLEYIFACVYEYVYLLCTVIYMYVHTNMCTCAHTCIFFSNHLYSYVDISHDRM